MGCFCACVTFVCYPLTFVSVRTHTTVTKGSVSRLIFKQVSYTPFLYLLYLTSVVILYDGKRMHVKSLLHFATVCIIFLLR
jgi:hypothetical protein